MRIVISGYYGFGNIGDEAVLSITVQGLRDRLPEAQIIVLSAAPEVTARSYAVKALPRANLPAVAEALSGCDLFLSGGGTLFQDATSWRSPLYYLGLLGSGLILAKRTMVYAQGFGPLRGRVARMLARWLLNRVDLITVRDEDTSTALRELKVTAPPIHVGADPAFALNPAPPERVQEILAQEAIDLDRPRIMVALRPWGEGEFFFPLQEALRDIGDRLNATIVFLSMQPAVDLTLIQGMAAAIGSRAHVLRTSYRPEEVLGLVGAMDILVGLRLHALIFSVAMGVVPVGLGYDPKVASLFREVGEGYYLPLEGLTFQLLSQTIEQAWVNRKACRNRLLEAAALLRARAMQPLDLAVRLMREGGL